MAGATTYDPKSKIENVKLDLSARELEILKLLSHGHSYKMIANKLDVSYSTINSHTKHIYDKLQVHSVVDAVMKAVQKKII
nr:response regulator transcription factor [Bacteroidota bacterium]